MERPVPGSRVQRNGARDDMEPVPCRSTVALQACVREPPKRTLVGVGEPSAWPGLDWTACPHFFTAKSRTPETANASVRTRGMGLGRKERAIREKIKNSQSLFPSDIPNNNANRAINSILLNLVPRAFWWAGEKALGTKSRLAYLWATNEVRDDPGFSSQYNTSSIENNGWLRRLGSVGAPFTLTKG